ncbi:MAG: ORF6N domain-containing protein [Acidobacteria bacterium]|nr:ORF6N domain-containing protein [Acidobacteriota bacterium]
MSRKPVTASIDQLPVPVQFLERRIHLIRGQKVMLDSDLAELYQVPTRTLNQAVRRNLERFPEDFMFQQTREEASALRSQIVTLAKGRGRYSKYAPLAFTEHGVAMLSSVLGSRRAVQMSILIVRAFVKLREALATHKGLARKIEQLEATQTQHGSIIAAVVQEIKKLKAPPRRRKPSIGFYADNKG